MADPAPARFRESLISSGTTEAAIVFLDVVPRAREKWTLALAGRERCGVNYHLERPSYAYHVLEYVAEGGGEVVMDGMRKRIEPGSLFFYGPRTRLGLRGDPRKPMLKYFFALAGAEVAARFAAIGLPRNSVRRLHSHAGIRTVADDLIREGQRPGARGREICLTLLELLRLKIDQAMAVPARGSPAEAAFLRCRSVIDAEGDELKTLREIARRAGIDPATACRLFRRFQGVTPYQYLLRRKMDRAAALLADSQLLVKEVAARVGFDDPYHFSRAFAKVHGCPPTALRPPVPEEH